MYLRLLPSTLGSGELGSLASTILRKEDFPVPQLPETPIESGSSFGSASISATTSASSP